MNFPKIEPLEARIAPATLSIGDVSVAEGNSGTTALTFTVTLSETATEEITVSYATADGSAVSTGNFPDFTAQSGMLTFAIGDQTKEITVDVNGDVFEEPNQTFTMTLSNPSGSNTLADGVATGTITNDDAAAVVSIAPAADVTEGAGAVSEFTVSLSHAVESAVTVNFATGAAADTAKPAPGHFTDYLAAAGTITFTPTDGLTKTISVTITDDTFKEDTEQFTVALSGASGATLGTALAVGKILNDADTEVGLFIADAKKVEGSAAGTVTLTAMLSSALASDLTFTIATQNGTAVAGSDYAATTQSVTIGANTVSKNFTVSIVGDTVFETTESFFVNVTGVTGVTVVNDNAVNPQVQASARVYLYNDDAQNLSARSVQWVDVDGDLVTMTVSKGLLDVANTDLFTFGAVNALGGKQLQRLDLQTFGTFFAGASVTIRAEKQAGFPGVSDGRVDVGYIHAAEFDADELRVSGIDLGVVTVDGDLGRITAGDSFSTAAISRLDVYSLGVRGTATQPADDASIESKVLGPISTVLVKQNVEGFLHVVGSEFGTIGTLKIGGALQGGSADNSGRISVSGRLSTATIGAITGGSGASSGLLNSLLSFATSSLGNITVLGDITGGPAKAGSPSGDSFSGAIIAPKIGSVSAKSVIGNSKENSGLIRSFSSIGKVTLSGDLRGGEHSGSGLISAGTTIGAVKIGGKIVGGAGEDSGVLATNGTIASLSVGGIAGGGGKGSGSVRAAVDNSGAVVGGAGTIGAIVITGKDAASMDSLTGGAGVNSGRIDAKGNIASFTAEGDVQGGDGSGSGVVKAGGRIDKVLIKGSLAGKDSAAADLAGSGALVAGTLRNVTIAGDIKSGAKGGAGAISASGAIRADLIESLTVKGNLVGNATNPVFITASAALGPLAIKSVNIGGNIDYAEIRAGYRDTTATTADAAIGTVVIGGAGKTVRALDIVAGAQAVDGKFGDGNDVASTGSGVVNNPNIVSSIANVIFKNAQAIQSAGAATSYGIVAQQIVAVSLGATRIGLTAGAGNDLAPGKVVGDATFHAVELAV